MPEASNPAKPQAAGSSVKSSRSGCLASLTARRTRWAVSLICRVLLAERGEQLLDGPPAALRLGEEVIDRGPHFSHGVLGLCVGRVDSEGAALLAVQPGALQQRLVHAALGRVALKAQPLLLRMLEHR